MQARPRGGVFHERVDLLDGYHGFELLIVKIIDFAVRASSLSPRPDRDSRARMAAAASSSSSNEPLNVDSIIAQLLEVRGSRPGKQVNLRESDIRGLCTSAREIFMNQPVLLELEAPIKICGA